MKDDWTMFDAVLNNLPNGTPAAGHSALVRDRCHKALGRPSLRRTVESLIVAGFCTAYVTIGAMVALRVVSRP